MILSSCESVHDNHHWLRCGTQSLLGSGRFARCRDRIGFTRTAWFDLVLAAVLPSVGCHKHRVVGWIGTANNKLTFDLSRPFLQFGLDKCANQQYDRGVFVFGACNGAVACEGRHDGDDGGSQCVAPRVGASSRKQERVRLPHFGTDDQGRMSASNGKCFCVIKDGKTPNKFIVGDLLTVVGDTKHKECGAMLPMKSLSHVD